MKLGVYRRNYVEIAFLTILLGVSLSTAVYSVVDCWRISDAWTISADWTYAVCDNDLSVTLFENILLFGSRTTSFEIDYGVDVSYILYENPEVTSWLSTVIQYVIEPFTYPRFQDYLGNFITATQMLPFIAVGMVVIGVVIMHYRRARAEEFVVTIPQLMIVAAVTIIGAAVMWIIFTTILSVFP